jgi:hypothetical protein
VPICIPPQRLRTQSKAESVLRQLLLPTESGKKYLAAFLAATPNESLRDPKRALVLANELIRVDREDPLLVEIRAAAHAALGEFTAVAADERAAMQAAKSLKWDTADMEARFASYQGSQPWCGELIPM